jgi:hypothetical protein
MNNRNEITFFLLLLLLNKNEIIIAYSCIFYFIVQGLYTVNHIQYSIFKNLNKNTKFRSRSLQMKRQHTSK